MEAQALRAEEWLQATHKYSLQLLFVAQHAQHAVCPEPYFRFLCLLIHDRKDRLLLSGSQAIPLLHY